MQKNKSYTGGEHKEGREIFGIWGFPFLLVQIIPTVPEWFYPGQAAPSRSSSVEVGWEQMTSSRPNAYIIRFFLSQKKRC